VEKIAKSFRGSKYKTEPFEELLKERLGEAPLFGGDSPGIIEMATKVAITSTTAIAQQAVVLTNYNRPDPINYGKLAGGRM